MRQLSQHFLYDLTNGFLNELVRAIHDDRDLDLQIRENYINVYYKGHSMLKLDARTSQPYRVDIDKEFTRGLQIPSIISNAAQTKFFVAQIPFLKHNIQRWRKRSIEMEYEQQLIRANNYEPRLNSDYLILDRQYTRKGDQEGYEIDLVAIRADTAVRKGSRHASFCFIELKYGLNQDIAQLAQQLDDYYKRVVTNPVALAREIEMVLLQKQELGLLRENVRLDQIRISADINQYEFLIILIDYNLKSASFVRALESLKQLTFASQIKIFRTGLALWQDQFMPLPQLA